MGQIWRQIRGILKGFGIDRISGLRVGRISCLRVGKISGLRVFRVIVLIFNVIYLLFMYCKGINFVFELYDST